VLQAGFLRAVEGGVTLAVRAQPGARKTAIQGIYGEGSAAQLKIAVQAPPVEGKANAALTEFLSDFFSLSRSKVELAQGELNRSKVFLLRGLTVSAVEAKLTEVVKS
jgi:uncharacterized protein (TIGR00251 family)